MTVDSDRDLGFAEWCRFISTATPSVATTASEQCCECTSRDTRTTRSLQFGFIDTLDDLVDFVDLSILDGDHPGDTITEGLGEPRGIEDFEHVADLIDPIGGTADEQRVQPNVRDDAKCLWTGAEAVETCHLADAAAKRTDTAREHAEDAGGTR